MYKSRGQDRLPRLGFLGTGGITSALVRGLCTRAVQTPYPIVVSPRTAETAARLSHAFPDRVSVAGTMQEVVDRSDWVILAVLPQAGEEVCRSLAFRPEQRVASLLCGIPLEQVRDWIGETAALVYLVPSAFHAQVDGPLILYPPQEEAAEIFGHLGGIHAVTEERQAMLLQVLTAGTLSFFTLLHLLSQWMKDTGIPAAEATSFVTHYCSALCRQADLCTPEELSRLAEQTTPGGLNDFVRQQIARGDGFSIWIRAMERAKERMCGS